MKKLNPVVQTAIFEALGSASMQWEPRPTGVFDSETCKKVGENLIKVLEDTEFNMFEPWPDDEYSIDTFSAAEFRVYDFAANGLVAAVYHLLDNPDQRGGVAREPWQGLRERLWALVDLAKFGRATLN